MIRKLKKSIRSVMGRTAVTRAFHAWMFVNFHRIRKILFFVRDARRTFRDMHWMPNGSGTYWATSAELLFQYHKLEKGLCIPGSKRFFGADPAIATMRLLARWRQQGFSLDDPIYRGAIETLRAYERRLHETPSPNHDSVLHSEVINELGRSLKISPELATPRNIANVADVNAGAILESLAAARRSVRSFKSTDVPRELLEQAVAIAQLSPSACNRQPCLVHVYRDRSKIDAMLEFQNGNRGFGHTIPVLLVLTAEASCFFDASERYEPYVDGGLFAMSLLLALQSRGLSSCCLNWCVEPEQDKLAHEVGNILSSERIIMYIAVGYAEDGALVARSPRRSVEQLIVSH